MTYVAHLTIALEAGLLADLLRTLVRITSPEGMLCLAGFVAFVCLWLMPCFQATLQLQSSAHGIGVPDQMLSHAADKILDPVVMPLRSCPE